MEQDILLDSGTNEVEILEFIVGKQKFGINVAKVQQIIPFEKSKLTSVPNAETSIMGVISWQDSPVNLIDLCAVLDIDHVEAKWPIVLVTNFNSVTNGFLVDEINIIHRVNWNQITPLNHFLKNCSSFTTGSITIEDREILLVDFEYIISTIFPETKMSYDINSFEEEATLKRENINIVFAEDSSFIRVAISDFLKKVGLNVHSFENGEAAFNYIDEMYKKSKSEGKEISKYINLVVTDIEMPKMDGLTLCRKIKQELLLESLPVVIFSSLINEQMSLKCKRVGADRFITKPRSKELVSIIDEVLHLENKHTEPE